MSLDLGMGDQIIALKLREDRAALIANNLANASTPYYKERDFDFAKALHDATGTSTTSPTLKMVATAPAHITKASPTDYELKYATPQQGSFDKNTVDTDLEQEKFAENTVQYQATLSFIKGNIKGLVLATQGE